MGATISLDETLRWRVHRSEASTVIDFLQTHAPDYPEFRHLFEAREFHDANGYWSFRELSLEGLHLLRQLLDQMEAKLPSVSAHYQDKFQPTFAEHLDALRALVDLRIQKVKGG